MKMKLFSKEHYRNIDWLLVGTVLVLNLIGLANLYGVTLESASWMRRLVLRQAVWSMLGIALMITIAGMSHKQLMRPALFLYIVAVVLVLLPILLGMQRKGAHSWFLLGTISIQPAEFAKLAVILLLARFLGSRSGQNKLHVIDIVVAGCIALLPAVIVAKQPDLGSALIFISISGCLLILAGLNRHWLIALVLVAAIGSVALFPHLKPYQQERIKVFLHPWEDSLDKGYNVVQSEIAIGSGQLFGKGFGKGSQTRYRFLPEYYTDFIFAGYVEQFGFAGGFLLLVFYTVLMLRLRRLALRAQDPEGFYLVGGVMALLGTHVVLNIAMTMGLLPVTGLPLPWLSYGGSSLLTSFISVGLALTTVKERYMF